LGLFQDNELLIEQLKSSIYGWCVLIEYYDGTFKFYNTPLFISEAKISQQKEFVYEINMGTAVPTVESFYDYISGVPTLPYFRADTTLLTADNEIYTADYEM
jgi:hypothetical protein